MYDEDPSQLLRPKEIDEATDWDRERLAYVHDPTPDDGWKARMALRVFTEHEFEEVLTPRERRILELRGKPRKALSFLEVGGYLDMNDSQVRAAQNAAINKNLSFNSKACFNGLLAGNDFGPMGRRDMAKAESAESAYNRYAPRYDECNSQNNYELWLGELLLPLLEMYGVRKGWALDGGCGTGPSFEPLLSRGWKVVGCDVSPGMLHVAHRKYGSRVPLFHADLRSLPTAFTSSEQSLPKEFQLIVTLNDVVNCLTEPGDLEDGFSGARRYLSHDGLLLFDTNLLSVYRTSSEMAQRMDKHGLEWRALPNHGQPGSIYEERLSGPEMDAHIHRQRHWTDRQVREALEASGLRCLAAFGQSEQADRILLSDTIDEERDYKVIYIAGRSA